MPKAHGEYQGPERRIDPENRMGPDSHAPRALNRFHGPNAEALATAPLREKGEAGDAFRGKVRGLLDRLEGKRSPEQQDFLDGLLVQTEAAASVWTEKIPIEGGPSQAQLIEGAQTWLQTLSPQILDGLRTLCPQTASLVVVPPLPVAQLLEILKAKNVPSAVEWDFWNGVKTESWMVGITDGRGEMPFDSTIYWENEVGGKAYTNLIMVAAYKERFEAQGLGIMPPHGYVPSAARVRAEERVMDPKSFTAFEQPHGQTFIPDGLWGHGDGLHLGKNYSDNSSGALRCRPWVEATLKF